MKRLGVVAHPAKPQAEDARRRLEILAGNRGIEIFDASQGLGDAGADMIVALGGDGTILRAAQTAVAAGVPLLGINVGYLGFLSAADEEDMATAIESIVAGSFQLEQRMLLQAELVSDKALPPALNEYVVEKAEPSRVVDIRVKVGEELVGTYTADGFIVSTPTGSTAYSLSAGGPVVEPGIEAMVLTPISAHYPLWRSIVTGAHRPVTLETTRGEASLTADGQTVCALTSGSEVRVRRFEKPLELVRLEGPRFFHRLKSRFHIEGS